MAPLNQHFNLGIGPEFTVAGTPLKVTILDPASPKLVRNNDCFSVTPHGELNSVIARGTGVGAGVLVQPT